MDQSFRKDHLMLESFNPGLTREEIAKIIEPFGPIKNIMTYRQVVNNIMYNFSLAIIHFGSKEGYEKALHSDTSHLGLRFIEIDPFFMRPYVAFIFGLPRPGNLAAHTKIFSPLGAKDIRMIEKATCKDDYIIVSTFDNKYTFRNFIKIVDKSYMSGNLLRVFPFALSKTNPVYSPSMPYLKKSIDNPEFFDFKLLYYDKEYQCWSGSAIANCNAIADAYNQFLIEKGENPNQEDQEINSANSKNSNSSENENSTKSDSEQIDKKKKEKRNVSQNNSDDSDYNEKDNSDDEVVIGDSDSDKEENSAASHKSEEKIIESDDEKESSNNDNNKNSSDEDSNNQEKDNPTNSQSDDNNNNEEDMTEYIVPEIPGPFELIVDYINGKTIQLTDTNAPFILLMSEKLGMNELYRESKRFVYECSDLESNAIMLGQLYELNGNINPLLSIIANKFEEICDSLTVRRYPMELIEMLISSPFFSMQDEDKLFEYIQEFKKTDSKKYQYLLKQVRIERLSSVELLKIVSDPTVDLNTIREGLMLQMKVPRKQVKISPLTISSLQQPKAPDGAVRYPNPPKNMKSIFGDSMSFGDIFRSECYKKEGDQLFNGIFSALKNSVNGQNPALAGIVNISASSEAHEHVYILLEYNTNIWFGTQDIENSYIRIDFKTRKVSLIGYSLKTHSHDGNGHITGWTLSGSNDNENWTVIDSMPMTDQFDSLGAERYYQLNNETPYYQYFELKQSRQNTMGYHNLRLSSIEFFGSIQQ